RSHGKFSRPSQTVMTWKLPRDPISLAMSAGTKPASDARAGPGVWVIMIQRALKFWKCISQTTHFITGVSDNTLSFLPPIQPIYVLLPHLFSLSKFHILIDS